jgi:hypothetical protein
VNRTEDQERRLKEAEERGTKVDKMLDSALRRADELRRKSDRVREKLEKFGDNGRLSHLGKETELQEIKLEDAQQKTEKEDDDDDDDG